MTETATPPEAGNRWMLADLYFSQCARCEGTGVVDATGETCRACDGVGTIEEWSER